MALITTPGQVAQDIAERLVDAGVSSVLNFAPAVLNVAASRFRAQGRPGGRTPDPGLLRAPAHGRPHEAAAKALRRSYQRKGRKSLPVDAAVYPVALLSAEPSCLVVGGGTSPNVRPRACSRPGHVSTWWPKKCWPPCATLAGAGRAVSKNARTGAGKWPAIGWPWPPPATAAVNRAVYRRRRERPGSGSTRPTTRPRARSSCRPWPARARSAWPYRPPGYSPALASWLKEHVAEHMGPEVAELAELLAEARAKLKAARPQHRRGRLAAEHGLGHARPDPLGSPSRSKGAPRGLSIAVVGMNHRTVPLQALEPLIVSHRLVPKALADLASRPHLDEVVVLSDLHAHRGLRPGQPVPRGHGRHPGVPRHLERQTARGVLGQPVLLLRRSRHQSPVQGGGRPGLGVARRAAKCWARCAKPGR